SLRYFFIGVTEPSPGMPRFVAVGYMDGQAFAWYNTETQSAEPRVSWMLQETQQYWDRQTRDAQDVEHFFHVTLDIL
ncbi:HA1B protein, partial [Alectura lathami]|nr:HA1B protein [Alectura lathami]